MDGAVPAFSPGMRHSKQSGPKRPLTSFLTYQQRIRVVLDLPWWLIKFPNKLISYRWNQTFLVQT
jgi:hypothetical protein